MERARKAVLILMKNSQFDRTLRYINFFLVQYNGRGLQVESDILGSRIILASGHGGTWNPGNVSERMNGCSPTNVKKECEFKVSYSSLL